MKAKRAGITALKERMSEKRWLAKVMIQQEIRRQ